MPTSLLLLSFVFIVPRVRFLVTATVNYPGTVPLAAVSLIGHVN